MRARIKFFGLAFAKSGAMSENINGTPEKLIYNTREAAAKLGCSPDKIYSLIKAGLLRASFASRHKMIPKAELDRFLATTCRSPRVGT